MADVIAITEGVKAAARISVWVPAITALAGIGGALGSQWLSHHFATARELRASEDKLARERYFIATELVFLLERFAQLCVLSATEAGDYADGCRIKVEHYLPEMNYSGVTGDWRSLPHELMYRISELPVLQEEGRKSIGSAFENDTPFDVSSGLHELNNQSCRPGLRAIRISRELRRTCGMPDDGLSAHYWSAWRVLASVRARIISAELMYARSHHKTMTTLSNRPYSLSSAETVMADRQNGATS